MVQASRFLALVLTALAMAPAYAHVLEMPAKLGLAPPEYLTVQQIYRGFGAIGAVVEPAAVAAAIVLAFLVRGRRAFVPAATGALCLIAALLIWVAVVSPVNAAWQAASPAALPEGFESLRMRWEWGHAARAALLVPGFVALVVAVLADMSGVAAVVVKRTVPEATAKTSASSRSAA